MDGDAVEGATDRPAWRSFDRTLYEGGIEAMRPCVMGTSHMAAAGHYAAAQAAATVLEEGGNAADAGVTAGIVLAVVQSDIVNFAGVAPIMVFTAETQEVQVISGLGHWPRAVTPDFFARHHGGAIPETLLRCVVPAAPAAWIACLDRFGTRSFGECAAPAIRLARDGFAANQFFVDQVTQFQDKYRRWPSNAAVYLPCDKPPVVGSRFVQADLAATMQHMADQERGAGGQGRRAGLRAARDAFYAGDIMRAIVGYHRENGGLLAEEDMRTFAVEVEPALSTAYGGMQVHACPPWCQGPVLLQALNILGNDDIRALGHNSEEYVHLVAEALNLAFADRDAYYTDPRTGTVPIDALVSPSYGQARRRSIDPGRAFGRMPSPGLVPANPSPGSDADPGLGARDTSYVGVVDRHGNAFSATPSDNSFEAPVVPGTGLCPSMRGSQSWAEPGLPGSVAPGKRPRLTPSPAIARLSGGGVMPFGSPGGDVQPQAMLQVLLNMAAFGMTPQEAVEAPRFASGNFPASFEPHGYKPGLLCVEGRVPATVRAGLRRRGHAVQDWPDFTWQAGAVCLVREDKEAGTLAAGADPRRPSYAAGR